MTGCIEKKFLTHENVAQNLQNIFA